MDGNYFIKIGRIADNYFQLENLKPDMNQGIFAQPVAARVMIELRNRALRG